VPSEKEILVHEVEKNATVTPQRPKLTREELIRRAAGHPGIHAPDPNAPPFRRVEPIECPGIPASELLIRDRR
jgi:hypothetical protein